MTKALIVGAAGFVGHYLIEHLRDDCGCSVSATKLANETVDCAGVTVVDLNILDTEEVVSLLASVRPDWIFHLAAQSSVSVSWKNPALTIDVNIKGAVNVLDAVRGLDYTPRVLLIGSGEEYGHVRPEEIPLREDSPLRPGNIYAATKVCQEMLGRIYVDAYKMDIMMVRAFNHIGPGQSPTFVVSDFCKQVAEIEAGKHQPVISVGNLSAKRDFTDVRDVVRAYSLLMLRGKNGKTYNVGSGHAIEIGEILKRILDLSTAKIEVKFDADRLRPVDIPVIEADIKSLRSATGWTLKIDLDDTLRETLDFWRDNN